jgi:hypothetical protein
MAAARFLQGGHEAMEKSADDGHIGKSYYSSRWGPML